MIALALIDRRVLIREALTCLLGGENIRVVAAVSSFPEILEQTLEPSPDIILFEFHPALAPDADMISRVRQAFPDVCIVAVGETTSVDDQAISLSAGYDGLLINNISAATLQQSLRLTLMGQKVFPTELLTWIASCAPKTLQDRSSRPMQADPISECEEKILRCLVRGDSNKRIANELSSTESAVKAHIKTILKKVHARNRTQAAIWALRHGLADKSGGSPSSASSEPEAKKRWLLRK